MRTGPQAWCRDRPRRQARAAHSLVGSDALLDGVGEFVGQQRPALVRLRPVLVTAEEDVGTDRERSRLHGTVELVGRRAGVQPHPSEVGAERVLHRAPQRLGELGTATVGPLDAGLDTRLERTAFPAHRPWRNRPPDPWPLVQRDRRRKDARRLGSLLVAHRFGGITEFGPATHDRTVEPAERRLYTRATVVTQRRTSYPPADPRLEHIGRRATVRIKRPIAPGVRDPAPDPAHVATARSPCARRRGGSLSQDVDDTVGDGVCLSFRWIVRWPNNHRRLPPHGARRRARCPITRPCVLAPIGGNHHVVMHTLALPPRVPTATGGRSSPGAASMMHETPATGQSTQVYRSGAPDTVDQPAVVAVDTDPVMSSVRLCVLRTPRS